MVFCDYIIFIPERCNVPYLFYSGISRVHIIESFLIIVWLYITNIYLILYFDYRISSSKKPIFVNSTSTVTLPQHLYTSEAALVYCKTLLWLRDISCSNLTVFLESFSLLWKFVISCVLDCIFFICITTVLNISVPPAWQFYVTCSSFSYTNIQQSKMDTSQHDMKLKFRGKWWISPFNKMLNNLKLISSLFCVKNTFWCGYGARISFPQNCQACSYISHVTYFISWNYTVSYIVSDMLCDMQFLLRYLWLHCCTNLIKPWSHNNCDLWQLWKNLNPWVRGDYYLVYAHSMLRKIRMGDKNVTI